MTMNGPYDLLLLDFGGVCLLNPTELHHVAEERLGIPPGTLTWLGPVDPSTDPLWRELMIESPVLREREYWNRRAADVGSAADLELSLTDYMSLLYTPASDTLIRPGCKRVVDQAFYSGMSVSILTNDLRAFHGLEWQQGITVLQQVDHVVDCSDTNILKPDPRAYQRALDIAGTSAAKTLFVDDQQLSVAGAEVVGIDALWFDISQPSESWDQVAEILAGERAVK